MQAVVLQQHGPLGRAELAGVADELLRRRQPGRQTVAQRDEKLTVVDLDPGRLVPGTRRQRDGLVEEPAGIRDDLVAAHPVVAGALLGAIGFGDDLGTVQRVVQRTPAGVGGVQREPCVEDRHHQLRARGGGDLLIDAGGGDGEVTRFGRQVTDLHEELLIGVEV